MKMIRITQVKSGIDRPERQKLTLRALGLTKMHAIKEVEATPQIRGMVRKVEHLVSVVEFEGADEPVEVVEMAEVETPVAKVEAAGPVATAEVAHVEAPVVADEAENVEIPATVEEPAVIAEEITKEEEPA